MEKLNLLKVPALSAMAYGAGSIVFLALYVAQGGTQVDWGAAAEALPYVHGTAAAMAGLIARSMLFVLPVLSAVAGLGFFHAMRRAGLLSLLATAAFVVGGFLLIHRGFITLALDSLAPRYMEATPGDREALAAVYDVLMSIWDAGNILGVVLAGVGTLLFCLAIRQTSFGPAWLAWLGFFAGTFTVLSPLHSLLVVTSTLLGVAWMLAMGVALWRTSELAAQVTLKAPST